MNADYSSMYDDNHKYMFGISVMGIDSDGSVVIDGQRTHTDVTDLSIESAEVLVLPLEGDEDASIDCQDVAEYEEEVGTYENSPHYPFREPPIEAIVPPELMSIVNEQVSKGQMSMAAKSTHKVKNNKFNEAYGPQLTCDFCPKKFFSEMQMLKHKCTIGNFIDLYNHNRAARNGGVHQCDICEKTFSQQSNLWKHIRSHTGERPFVCSVCNKGFTQLANLQKHNLVHTGEKPHQCPTCFKHFSQQANMVKHQLLHSGIRPYACKDCGKAFSQRSNLAKHELLHRGIKPFSCKVCFKAFTQQSNLRKHECQHFNYRPHKCTYCNKCYIQKVSLDRHILRCTGPTFPDSDMILPANNSSSNPNHHHFMELLVDETMEGLAAVLTNQIPVSLDSIKQEYTELIDIKQEMF